MEVAPFFVDFHHFLSIFIIFYRFSRFTHFCRDLHFVGIYALFPQFFLAKIAISATSHVFCMYELRIVWQWFGQMGGATVKMHFQLIVISNDYNWPLSKLKQIFWMTLCFWCSFWETRGGQIFGITCALHSSQLLFLMNQGKIYVSISIFEKAVL